MVTSQVPSYLNYSVILLQWRWTLTPKYLMTLCQNTIPGSRFSSPLCERAEKHVFPVFCKSSWF